MHAGRARAAWPVGLAVSAAALTGLLTQVAYMTEPFMALVVLGGAGALVLALVRPLWLLYAAMASIPLGVLGFTTGGGATVSPSEALFALAGLGWAARRVATGYAPVVRTPVTLPLALMLCAILLGVSVTVDAAITLNRLALWTCFVLTTMLIADQAGLAQVRVLVIVLVAVGAIEGGLAAITMDPGVAATGSSPEERAAGSFTQPNYLGGFLAVVLPLALVLTLRGSPAQRALAGAAAAAIAAGLVLSQSRGALIGAAAALVVLLALPSFRRAVSVGLAVVVGLVVATSLGWGGGLAATPSLQAVETRFTQIDQSGAADQRTDIWAGSLDLALDHPVVGVGLANFPAYAPSYGILEDGTREPFLHAHNLPLNIVAELGALGLVAFVWMTVNLLAMLGRTALGGTDQRSLYAVGLLGSFAAVSLHGIADYLFSLNVLAAILFVVLGCAVAVGAAQHEPEEHARPS